MNKDKNKNKNKNKDDETTETEILVPDNQICMDFRDKLNEMIDRTRLHMPECSYTAKKGGSKILKADVKFTKKWRKVMAQYQHGAYNQPDGSLCEKEWVAWPEE